MSSSSPRRLQSATLSTSASTNACVTSTSTMAMTSSGMNGITTTASLLIVPDEDQQYAQHVLASHSVSAKRGTASHVNQSQNPQHQPHCSMGVNISPCQVSSSSSAGVTTSQQQFASSSSQEGSQVNSSSASGSGSSNKKNIMNLNPATNFEAFSLHFHLPLKAAAEKFGVRATAFKKRCRAIGIRHWPYRKVRSLKRSLQELNRCKDQGSLNEKQQYQYATFKKQLDKLMSPETYGIDPSGRLVHNSHHAHAHAHALAHAHSHSQSFDDDEDDSGDDTAFDTHDSPRFGATFSDCTISPADCDKPQPFPEFPASPHLRLVRKSSPHGLPGSHAGHGHGGHGGHLSKTMNLSSSSFQDLTNVSVRVSSTKESPVLGGYGASAKGYPFGVYEQYLHESDRTLMNSKNHGSSEDAEDLVGCGDHPSSGSALDNSSNHGGDFMGGDIKYDDVRSLHEADEEFHDHSMTSHLDYSSERFFDDVFLQISPDYGCLV